MEHCGNEPRPKDHDGTERGEFQQNDRTKGGLDGGMVIAIPATGKMIGPFLS
jgi:hypothetical protein